MNRKCCQMPEKQANSLPARYCSAWQGDTLNKKQSAAVTWPADGG